jgi:hypothetical protein
MTESASELHRVAEDVLPEIEKFLESPVERRLRRLRSGMIVAFIGLGVMLGGIVASLAEEGLFVLVIPGFIALFIGLALITNGLVLTIPRKKFPDRSPEGLSQKSLDAGTKASGFASTALVPDTPTNDLNAGERASLSVTEHTTHQLKTVR